jgi:hypothetical protein
MHYDGKQLILESSDKNILPGDATVLNETVLVELRKLT